MLLTITRDGALFQGKINSNLSARGRGILHDEKFIQASDNSAEEADLQTATLRLNAEGACFSYIYTQTLNAPDGLLPA